MLLPRFERFKPHTDTDLVYLKSSPDYCEFDVKRGSLGTHGRECDHVWPCKICSLLGVKSSDSRYSLLNRKFPELED